MDLSNRCNKNKNKHGNNLCEIKRLNIEELQKPKDVPDRKPRAQSKNFASSGSSYLQIFNNYDTKNNSIVKLSEIKKKSKHILNE